ncbi:MAG: adenosylcobinamide-GDP ribazoletransferase [Kiritimatiellae bacterium]|nr:adenosylcobinamide-GDP ribazoletransferase [Kiritimatiellia bacterium]
MRGLITALRTLTGIPVPGRDANRLSAALPWFPLVGLMVGALLYGAGWVVQRYVAPDWPAAVALTVVVLQVLITRGLHLDGVADWADGFWGARDRAKVLAIMKDPRIGSFGMAAASLTLLAKWTAFARLAALGMLAWVIAACVVSRTVLVALAARLPYARVEHGTAGSFVEGARVWHYLIASGSALVLLTAGFGPAGGVALGVGWLAACVFGLWCRRRVGGITGDLLGAANELVELLILFAAAVLGSAHIMT